MKRIGLLKNQHNNIVVLIPKHIAQISLHAKVYVESDAGAAIGYSDNDYVLAGAQIVANKQLLLAKCDVILTYNELPRKIDFSEKKTCITFLNLLFDFSPLEVLLGKNADVYSLDLMPRTSIAQSMDVLSSVAAISGYQAVLTAAHLLPTSVPMISSAGGTLRPARFLIIGSGVAGLQAIATAKRLGGIVKAFDVRKASQTEVESLGAEFIDIDGAIENKNSGGYAVEQTNDYLDRIERIIRSEASLSDVIITTAKIPGMRAPILISEETVNSMKPNSVIIDLAAETGGNCTLTKPNITVLHNQVKIIGNTLIISDCAESASTLISGNYAAFIQHFIKHDSQNTQDEILLHTKAITAGEITNEKLNQLIDQY